MANKKLKKKKKEKTDPDPDRGEPGGGKGDDGNEADAEEIQIEGTPITGDPKNESSNLEKDGTQSEAKAEMGRFSLKPIGEIPPDQLLTEESQGPDSQTDTLTPDLERIILKLEDETGTVAKMFEWEYFITLFRDDMFDELLNQRLENHVRKTKFPPLPGKNRMKCVQLRD